VVARMKETSKQITIAFMFIAILLAILIYILYRINDTVTRYRQMNENDQELMKKSIAPGKNALLDRSNDNNEFLVDQSSTEGERDEYTEITKTIRQKFSEYQTYNKSLEDHYKATRNQTAPDVIDQSSMKVENDNW
jgi:cytoskeletal protein RodZ